MTPRAPQPDILSHRPPFMLERAAPDVLLLIGTAAGVAGRMTTAVRGPADWLDHVEQALINYGTYPEPRPLLRPMQGT